MIKLDSVRTGILSGDPQAWDLAQRVLDNPKTTAYKRAAVQELLDTHPRPGSQQPETPAPAVSIASALVSPLPAPTGDAPARWILQAAGVPDAIIEAALAALATTSVTVPVTPAADAPAQVQAMDASADMSEEDAGDLVIEDDPVLRQMRREARRRTVGQYEERVLRLGRAIGFSQYIRGQHGKAAFEENLRDVVTEALAG